jgi:COMPASS component SWD3
VQLEILKLKSLMIHSMTVSDSCCYYTEGAWDEVDKLLMKPLVRSANAFKYAVFKQQFLEHIEQREYQKAFTILNKRLKGLEHYQPFAGEFRDLCYLLSCE